MIHIYSPYNPVSIQIKSLAFQTAYSTTPITPFTAFLKKVAAFPLLVLVILQLLQFFCAFFLHAQIPMPPDD